MKVIICGAGEVGRNIARYLSLEDNDVSIIDEEAELITKISMEEDIRSIVGNAAFPEILKKAGANDAELIIAVTRYDEVNMAICQVAHSLFNVPTKVARIRQQEYLKSEWKTALFSEENMPIDNIISPEEEVAKTIATRLEVPFAREVIHLGKSKMRLLQLPIHSNCPLSNTSLQQIAELFPDINMKIVAISRNDEFIPTNTGQEEFVTGDDIYLIVEERQLNRALSVFGFDTEASKSFLIIGAGRVGKKLVESLSVNKGDKVSLIEIDKTKSIEAAKELQEYNVQVFHGDGMDQNLLIEAGSEGSDAIITVTDDDETNAFTSLLGKRLNIKHALAMINRKGYDALLENIGIDSVIAPGSITVSSILRHIRRGRILNAYTIENEKAEVIEAIATENSNIIETNDIPKDIVIGAIIRNDEIIMSYDKLETEINDHIIAIAPKEKISLAEKLFSVSLKWF